MGGKKPIINQNLAIGDKASTDCRQLLLAKRLGIGYSEQGAAGHTGSWLKIIRMLPALGATLTSSDAPSATIKNA